MLFYFGTRGCRNEEFSDEIMISRRIVVEKDPSFTVLPSTNGWYWRMEMCLKGEGTTMTSHTLAGGHWAVTN